MSIERILQGLNPAQIKAVSVVDGPLLVIAGAGSGKTRVLTNRIAYLIEKGIQPYNLLALTFTNKAAREMKSRISNIVDYTKADRVLAGTFHSVFARILRIEAEQIGYKGTFSIYDSDDSLKIVKSVGNNLGISLEKYQPGALRAGISWAKNQMTGWQEFSEKAESIFEKITAQVYEQYQQTLITNNAMDFDDLLLNMIYLLESSPKILEKYQDKFQYILVDEYQDTNRAQYYVINLLAKKYRNICVVGDDAQSIYRWRGAEIRNILDFQKDYPEAVVVPLEQNYRSTKTIISAADSVIKKNTHQLKKTLWTDNPEGELIEIIECDNDGQEADVIVNLVVKAKTETDFKPEDFAVLYRTNAQSLALEKSFIKENIPYVIVGGTSFYQRKEIKDTLAYFKILINPSDSESLLRVVNEPPRGIGLTSLKHLRTYAQDNKKSLFDVFEIAHKVPELQTRAVTAVKKFIEFVKSYEIKRLKLPPEELAVDFIEESGLLQMYKDINTEESLDKWNNIQQLLSDMQEFFRKEENANIEEYLQQVTLITDLDKKDINQKQVKMMTLHSAKGLEFPVVVISGVEHGLFPLAKAEMHPEEEEEERRLFYVGITRAMEKLYITYAYKRLRFGEYRDSMPSKFIKEIDLKFLQHKTATVGQKQNFANGSFPSIPKNKTYSNNSNFNKTKNFSYGQTEQATPASDTTYPFKVGDRVNHAHFGAGKVLAMTGVGQNAKAVVDFKGVGRKVLMLQFAKLEKIG